MEETRIKRFRFLTGCKPRAQISNFLSWLNKDATSHASFRLYDSIYLEIGFPDDLETWDDFDYVLVMDEDFGQPFTPFYSYLNGESNLYPVLEKVIKRYNEVMSQLPYLEEIK